MGALEGGRIRPYAGPYPERFAVTVETDKPDELTGLVEELEGMGFASVQTAPLSGELRGFSIIWSGSSDEPTVAGPLEAVVRRAMEEIGAEGFSLETVKLGDDSSPQRIVVQIPTEGIDDGSLRERLRARASRFDLSIHKHSSEDWPELCEELRSYGFGSVSQRTGSRDREIRYGGAPSYLISEIKALVLEHVGVDIPVEKAWPDSDNDIWLFLPRQDDSAIRSEEEGDNTGDFDVDSWLREVDSDPGEPTPFVHVEAESLRVGDVTLRRLSGPRHESAPDPGAFAHYCLDEHTAATLAHVATCALLREPCLLEGETSTSKTSSVLYLASLLNQPVARLNLNGPQDLALELPFRPDDLRESSDLLEPETKLILTRADEESRALSALEVQQIMANERMHSHPWRWHDGLVVQAMRHGWWVILDEVNLAEPQILERLNSVLERDPYLVVTEHCNEVIGGSKTPVHPSFRIFATMNPAEYAGRSTLSPAYRDRWRGYRYVSPPGERGYLAMLRYLVYGAQPPVTLRGRAYTGGSATVPALGSLAEIDHIAELLTALARFHAGLEAAVRSEDGTARLGARRKERYVFTRRGLLSVMDFLGSVLAGEDGTQKILAFRRALLRYYVGRVATSADRNVVVRLLDAAGIGPNTWSIGAPGESSGGDGDSDGGPDSGDQGGDR